MKTWRSPEVLYMRALLNCGHKWAAWPHWYLYVAHARGGGGGLPYESDGDARRKIRINTLKETNLGVAPALFNP